MSDQFITWETVRNLFIGFLVIKLIIEITLEKMNQQHIEDNKDSVPQDFKIILL